MAIVFDKQSAQRISAVVRGWEALPTDATTGVKSGLAAVRYDLLSAYNVGDSMIPQHGLCYVVAIHSDGVRAAVRQCAFGGLTQIGVACGAIGAGSVGKVSVAVGAQVRVRVASGVRITAGVTRLGAQAESYDAVADSLGPFIALAEAIDNVALCLRTDAPAAPKLVYTSDGQLIGAFKTVIYGDEYGVTRAQDSASLGIVDVSE